MLQYTIKKIFYALLVVWGVVSVIFFLFNVLPVDPARLTMGQRTDIETVQNIREELGLNKPMWVRYGIYLNDLSPISWNERSDKAKEKYNYSVLIPLGKSAIVWKTPYLGRSFQNGNLVSTILAQRIPTTFLLAITAIAIAVFIGVILGIVAALNHNSRIDDAAVTLSVFGISQPSYVVATIVAFFIGYKLHDLTGLNHRGPLFDLNDYGDEIIVWKNLLLPAVALGIRPIGIVTQLTRSSMLDVMSQDYIRTARSKGLGEWVVIFKHALRNAMNPVITSVSGWFAALLAGSVFVESIFDFKGLGDETITALLNFDFPIVMGSIIFVSVVFVTINILVDILYGLLDPRISITK